MADAIIVDDNMDRLRAMDTEQLKTEFLGCLGKTTQSIIETAQCILVMDEKQIDTSDIVNPWFNIIRRVAYKQLLPEIITKISDRTTFEKVASLPIPEQQLVADNKPFKVATALKTDGEIDYRLLTVDVMTPEQKSLVFARGSVRTLEQQWQRIASKNSAVDREGVVINPTAAQYARLLREAEKKKTTIGRLILSTLESVGII